MSRCSGGELVLRWNTEGKIDTDICRGCSGKRDIILTDVCDFL